MKKAYDTLNYYNSNAKEFYNQTVFADFERIYKKVFMFLPKHSYILDFGCGSGRDSKYFMDRGYFVKPCDGSIEMCKLASKYLNRKVICMDFLDLNEVNTYDCIWACSSILHVEDDHLLEVFNKMIDALKVGGIIYTSFKVGEGYMIKEGKYYRFLTKKEMIQLLEKTGKSVKLIDYFENEPLARRTSNSNETWGNYIIQKYG